MSVVNDATRLASQRCAGVAGSARRRPAATMGLARTFLFVGAGSCPTPVRTHRGHGKDADTAPRTAPEKRMTEWGSTPGTSMSSPQMEFC